MTNVRKRSGELQDFDPAKLEASMTNAGAKSEYAAKISERIARQISEGMATADIVTMVAMELSAYDRNAAQRYEAYSRH